MRGFRGDLEEGETGTQSHGGTHARRTPQGITGTCVQAEGVKWGGRTDVGTAADVDTRRGAQGRAAEADGRQVRATSRWAALRTGRGVGERVKI